MVGLLLLLTAASPITRRSAWLLFDDDVHAINILDAAPGHGVQILIRQICLALFRRLTWFGCFFFHDDSPFDAWKRFIRLTL